MSVAPAAFPMPSARCPALRPIAITKYHRDVVLASTMRFLTISTPKWRAVWNPKVSTYGGMSRSLSMVFGTWTTLHPASRLLLELHGGKRRVVAADRDELGHVEAEQGDDRLLQVRGVLGRIGPRDPDMRAAAKVDPADIVDFERRDVFDVATHDPLEPVAEAEYFDPLEPSANGRRPNDGVDAGGRAPADRESPSFLRCPLDSPSARSARPARDPNSAAGEKHAGNGWAILGPP